MLWIPKVHYRVHKNPILTSTNPIYISPCYLSRIRLNIMQPPTFGLLMVSFPLAIPPITYMPPSSSQSYYMPYHSHPPRLDHSNYTILGEDYKLWNSSSCTSNFSILLSSHFSSRQISSAPCSRTLSVHVALLMSETKFHTHTEPLYIYIYTILFTLLDSRQEDKGSELNGSKYCQNSNFS
jgi:hypothetical protein